LLILLRDLGEAEPDIYLAGSQASMLEKRVTELLGRHVESLSRCAAAQGCAWIAEDVFHGANHILSISVDERARIREGEAAFLPRIS